MGFIFAVHADSHGKWFSSVYIRLESNIIVNKYRFFISL